MADRIFENMMQGFGLVLGIAITLTTVNVISSYVLPEGATLSEYLNSKLQLAGASQ